MTQSIRVRETLWLLEAWKLLQCSPSHLCPCARAYIAGWAPRLISEGQERGRLAQLRGVVSGPHPGQWCLGREGFTCCRLCVVFVLGDVPSTVLVLGAQEGCGGSCTLVTSYAVPVPLVSPSLPSFVCRVAGQPMVAPGAWLAAWHQGVVLSLQDLGVTKVGHMKRILCGIKELSRSPPATEA